MKVSLSLLSAAALLLAGCGSAPLDDSAGAGGTGGCTYASKAYGAGAVSCQDRTAFRCEGGVWNSTFKSC
jgi:hypothetical protein